jgi:hypothetical protein
MKGGRERNRCREGRTIEGKNRKEQKVEREGDWRGEERETEGEKGER